MHRSLVLRNRQRIRGIDLRLLRRIVRTLLDDALGVEQYDVGVFLIAAPEMTLNNETFLRHAGSTDVITFDYTAQNDFLHGEIFVCVDEAVVQARRFHTRWPSELVRYVIHGVLHLRGFDDRRPAARRKMKRKEDQLLCEIAVRFALSRLARRPKLRA
jgi:rRNA maturation RNase YbeY